MPVIGTKDKPLRFSFVQVWEPKAFNPGDEPKYSVQVLVPKEYKDIVAQVDDLIDKAIKLGISKGKITDVNVKNREFRMPFRDGDEEAADGDAAKAYLKGHMFFNATAKANQQPSVVNKYAQPIMRRDEFYSGCYGVVDVNFFAYKNKGMGVACGLNSILKRDDGERLDNRQSAESAFANYKDEQGDEEADLK